MHAYALLQELNERDRENKSSRRNCIVLCPPYQAEPAPMLDEITSAFDLSMVSSSTPYGGASNRKALDAGVLHFPVGPDTRRSQYLLRS
jgi:hypothetical protein